MDTPSMVDLSRFRATDDYNGDTALEHDCGWQHDWPFRDSVTLQDLVNAATAHVAAGCDDLPRTSTVTARDGAGVRVHVLGRRS